MHTFDDVLANPRPCLDENGSQEQLKAYREALQALTSEKTTSVITIPAGAGSGKTRTLVSTIIGLLRIGTDPELIESISFTNASADDFQEKLIESLVELNQEDPMIPVVNLGFSTIHKHAVDLLKKLEPHVGGVGYYFEDASTSNSLSSHDGIERENREKAIRLALYSSIVYGGADGQLIESLRPFIEQDDSEARFILSDIRAEDHRRRAEDFIRKDMMSDAGLGAFTNIDDTNPDFCVAVATDALMRLQEQTAQVDITEKRQRFGLPQYLMVDEAQDLDLIQLFYLRALAINGVSVLMVGDPRQTLYEFRNSVSEWPFDEAFMQALFIGTGIKPGISSSPLRTNYRSRKEIIDFAENLSAYFVDQSTVSSSPKVTPINDPVGSVVRSHPKLIDGESNEEKLAPAVRLLQGAKTDRLDLLKAPTPKIQQEKLTGPLGRLARRTTEVNEQAENTEDAKALQRKLTHIQLPNLCGGDSETAIKKAIIELYEKAKGGDSVAILTRNGLKPADFNFLRGILREHNPAIDNPSELLIDQINSEKNAPLSQYWFLTSEQSSNQAVPFTSMMISAAMHFFLSWDKSASDEVKLQGLREVNTVVPASTYEEAVEKNNRNAALISIAIEIKPFVAALLANESDFFPHLSRLDITAKHEALTRILSRFVFDVLMRYSVTIWENFRGRVFSSQPCRFQSMAVERNPGRGLLQLRPLSDSKRFFKLFWEAIVNTPFKLSDEDRAAIGTCGLAVEYTKITTTLLNFPEEITSWKEQIERSGSNVTSEVISRKETFIRQRELIHEQFSKVYHHKTRTYLREIASELGKLIRLDPTSDPNSLLIQGFEHFRSARQKARVSTWAKEGRSKVSYLGLFEDLISGMRDIDISSRPKTKNPTDEATSAPKITVTTIHSSKGLEWDHVLLFFPQPSSRDKDSSFKSVRDLLYVAITRAARTLTMVIGSDKNYKESPTNTSMKIALHLVNEHGRNEDLFDRRVEFGCLENRAEETTQKMFEVNRQTSHSELERALSCRIHHHTQHERSLSTMVPLTAPSYSFFFHTAMSSLCAGLIGQRLPIPEDPILDVVRVIDSLASKTDLTEEQVYQSLMLHSGSSINDLMQSMVPMYFLSGGKRFTEVINYYTENFARQLASITLGSKLFQNLLIAKRLPGHKIWIEKPIKDVLSLQEDGKTTYLPVIGIPDIKISGSEINYVCDYKTVATPRDPEQTLANETLQSLSEKTFMQINLYQGLLNEHGTAPFSEIIYVPDISLMEGEDIPEVTPPPPQFNNSAQFRVRSNLANAVVIYTDQFDTSRFESTTDNVAELRYQAESHLQAIPAALFSPVPLIGENCTTEVTEDICQSCPSAIHCAKKKSAREVLA